MYGYLIRLLRQNVKRVSRRFDLAMASPPFAQRFSLILQAFLDGYNCVLIHPLHPMNVCETLNRRYNPFYRGFSYEGIGMGLGARTLLFRSELISFESQIQRLQPGYLYQYYVGLGWWLHMRYRNRLAGYRKWMQHLHPHFAPIVFDGVGFKIGLFQYRHRPEAIAQFDVFPAAYRRVCYQGLGRSLWFLGQFKMDDVYVKLQGFERSDRLDAISGIGLAVAYSMFDKPEVVEHALQTVEPVDRAAFLQGLGFGWEARRLQNETYWLQQVPRYEERVQSLMQESLTAIRETRNALQQADPHQFYERWIDKTREWLDFYLLQKESK